VARRIDRPNRSGIRVNFAVTGMGGKKQPDHGAQGRHLSQGQVNEDDATAQDVQPSIGVEQPQ
jgi:hypothetical protein